MKNPPVAPKKKSKAWNSKKPEMRCPSLRYETIILTYEENKWKVMETQLKTFNKKLQSWQLGFRFKFMFEFRFNVVYLFTNSKSLYKRRNIITDGHSFWENKNPIRIDTQNNLDDEMRSQKEES